MLAPGAESALRGERALFAEVTAWPRDLRASARSIPTCEARSAVRAPASSRARILSRVLPFPPEIIAPACPMRLSFGAWRPPMNAMRGFENAPEAIISAASSSMVPPSSPIMTTASVSLSSWNRARISAKRVPGTGSPPTPTRVDTPKPARTTMAVTSLVRLPERVITPMRPGL